MPKTTFAEHPLHPMLIVLPTGLLPFSLVMDLLHLFTRRKSFAECAYYSMVGGYVGGLAAGIAGGADYFAIPPQTQTKKVANIHAVLNVLGLGLFSVNLLLRRRRERPSGIFTTLLSMIGVSGLLVSAWYGGHMVYEHGMRVKGVSPTARAREIRLPGSDRVSEWMHQVEERFAPEESLPA